MMARRINKSTAIDEDLFGVLKVCIYRRLLKEDVLASLSWN